MPTPWWGVAIQGDPADLSVWRHKLKHQSDVWVETHNSETVLRATSLDELESACEVRDRAIAYIDRLNGAMALSHDSRPVQATGVVIRFTPDGNLHRNLFVEPGGFELRGSIAAVTVTVIGPDGKPVPPPAPAPSEVQCWSEIADQETLLDDALVHFGRATNDNWFDIYKALECLTNKYGGKPRGRWARFVKLDWASAGEVERLKRSANLFRHAKKQKNNEEKKEAREFNPMSSKEARELLGQLLRRALQEAAKQGGHGRPTP